MTRHVACMTKQRICATYLFEDLRSKVYMGEQGIEPEIIFKLMLEKQVLKKVTRSRHLVVSNSEDTREGLSFLRHFFIFTIYYSESAINVYVQ
jgi:hypothetical protein